MREIIMTHVVIFEKREIIIGFSNCEGIADRRPPRREQTPHGREMVAKPRSPRREPAMNSARTGETRPRQQRINSGLTAELIRLDSGINSDLGDAQKLMTRLGAMGSERCHFHGAPSLRARPSLYHERVRRRVSKAGRVETVSRICGVGGRGAAKSAGGRRNGGWLR